MNIRKKILFTLLAVILIYDSQTKCQERQNIDQLQINWFGVSTLKDVREVYPKIGLEIIEKDTNEPDFTSQIGPLTQKDLQSYLEQMLQKSGITITSKFSATSVNSPLSMNVTVLAKVRNDTPLPAYAVFIYTEAMQPVTLVRNSKIRSFNRTWPMVPTGSGTRTLLFLTPETIVKKVTDEVTRQVRNFIIDYSAANPSKKINIPTIEKPSENKPVENKPEEKTTSPEPEQNTI